MSDLDPRALRNAFGSYMTGVTVVTSKAANGTPIGFTANSFSSVSLDPPLLLVCPGKFLSSYEAFSNCSHFAVNILAEGQEDIANTFAGFKGDRFARTPHSEDALGSPLIDGAIAHFSCTRQNSIEAGDHAVLIGAVHDFNHGPGRGLGYVGGRFFSLGLERAALAQTGNQAVCGAIISLGDQLLLEPTEAGYRPPGIVANDRGNLRQTLAQRLEERGLSVRLGQAYSVFDERDAHNCYYLATVDDYDGKELETQPISKLAQLEFASRPITDMMNRFALEARTRSFGLYVGDSRRGDVHHPPERI